MKTIFVDDERLMIEQFIEDIKGIDEIELVGQFDDPFDALLYCGDNEIDLAFIDVEMPGMNGLDLAEKIGEICPDVKIIFISAYDFDVVKKPNMSEKRFITKPYKQSDITKALSINGWTYSER